MNSAATATLDESLARTAQTYDALPYSSKPFTQSHPSRLGAVAHLFGLQAPPLARARILELGCAAGGNVIPIAAYHPEAQVLGIDFSATQVEAGRARIARLGLTNIELRCQSITDLEHDIGEFDYIIAHGVYSWVPQPVREAILAIAGRHLSPQGIAYVSYNVLPGWHMKKPLREAFQLLIPASLPPADRVRMARRLLDFMKETTPDKGPYGEILRQAPGNLAASEDDYIFHDYMEIDNEAFAFTHFNTAASEVGLGYLGEAEIQSMIASNYGKDFAERVQKVTTNDIATHEQMMDVLTGRAFRQTLLVRQERLPEIQRYIPPERIDPLHISGLRNARLEKEGANFKLVDARGTVFAGTGAAKAEMAQRLARTKPGSISVAECLDGFSGEDLEATRISLYQLVISGTLKASIDPMTAAAASFQPRASVLARSDAEAGEAFTSNPLHEAVRFDPVAKTLLPHLDGKTTRRQMEQLLFDAALSGKFTLQQNNVPITDAGRLRNAIQEMLPKLLGTIAKSAVFEA